MIRQKRLVGAVFVGAVCGLVGIVGVLPAVGKSSPPSSPWSWGRRPPSSPRRRSEAVRLRRCAPGDYASLTISLSERSVRDCFGLRKRGSDQLHGQIETITVPVTARGKAFVKGTAFARATFFDCGPYFAADDGVALREVEDEALVGE